MPSVLIHVFTNFQPAKDNMSTSYYIIIITVLTSKHYPTNVNKQIKMIIVFIISSMKASQNSQTFNTIK